MSFRNGRSEPKEILGLNRITKKRLLELCRKDRLYQTPALNDVLYLHFQGFQCIECLEEYTELKCLWLESNALSEIQGLENQHKLKCLFLQSNLIKKIENLECCKELDTINLSQNQIRKIENVNSDILPVLNTLNLSSNYITDSEGLKELENCKNLSVVDLSNNRIHDILIVKIFAKMPELKVLILQGNPVVSKIPQYRKTLILECKNLTYLDARPVFPKDRACAEAWKRGGYQEERKENERWNRKDRRKIRDSVNATIRMRNRNRKPDDQLSILVSSDSEDEAVARERRQQHQELDAGVSMELGLWDEVDKNIDHKASESASSSDMNVSSSTSVISTTDSNADTSNGSFKEDDEDESRKKCKEEEKILNSMENMSKDIVVDLLGQDNLMESYIKQNDLNQSLTVEMKDLPPESPNEIQESDSLKKSKKTELNIEEANDKSIEQIPGNNLNQNDAESVSQEQSQILPLIEVSTECRSSDESDEPKETYDPTIEAIHRATMNNLSDVEASPKTFERRVFLQIETNEDNYEAINEMEEVMNTLTAKEDTKRESPRPLNDTTVEEELNIPKTQTQLETEDKFAKINEEVTKNFEKISSNMDVAMAQFQKDQEERQRLFAALFSQEEAAKDPTSEESNGEMNEMNMENKRIDRMVDQWDRQTRLKGGKKRKVINTSFSTSQQIDMWTESSGPTDNIKISTSMTTKTDFNLYELLESSIENEKSAEDPSRSIKRDVEIGTPRSKTGSGDGPPEHEDSDNHVIGHKQDAPDEIVIRAFVENITNSEGRDKKVEDANKKEKIVGNEEESDHCKTERITNLGDAVEHFSEYEDKGHTNLEASTMINAATANLEETETQTIGNTLEVDNPFDVAAVTLEANEAWKAFEKETKCLKVLLQKLEDDNEQLYKDLGNKENSQVQQESASSNKEVEELQQENNLESPETIVEIATNNKETHIEEIRHNERAEESSLISDDKNVEINEESNRICESGSDSPRGANVVEDQNEVICEQIVSDMVEALDVKQQKSLNYQFPEDLETDEDSDGGEPRKPLPISNTIRNVIDSFNGIFDQKSPQGYMYRFGNEKTSVLKQLANSPNLQQFNQDTHETLDKQLAAYEQEQSNTVRGIVDRVYAQKDRYDDTIELIDGKLMVVHKDTGELSTLASPSRVNANSDESDGHYDTAESDLEDGADSIKPHRKNCRGCSHDGWRSFASPSSSDALSKETADSCSKTQADKHVNVWPRRWGPYTLKDYKPSETRMREALGPPKYDVESDDDESNFYSMDDQKPETVYGRMDNEICGSMTFDHINILSDEDENHIVQCARSYEELRAVLKAEKEEARVLTTEENELLEKMVESKYTRGVVDNPLIDSADMQLADDDQLRVLMDRNREYSARDIRNKSQSETSIFKPAADHIKILEYKPYAASMEESNVYAADLEETGDTISVASDCAEIYGNDIFSYIHGEELETKKEEAEIFVQNVLNWKKYECVNYKEIKETLNRKEKQLDNEDEEIESLKTNRCSESEKNEIEFNVDIELQMEEPEKQKSSAFLDDLQEIAKSLEEIPDYRLDSNESEDLTHQLNDLLNRFERLPDLDRDSEDINRQVTEDINRSADETIIEYFGNIESLSEIKELEKIDEDHKDHKEEMYSMYQTDENNSLQQIVDFADMPSCNTYELKTELHDETIQEAVIVDSELPSCNPYELKTELHDETIQEAVIVDSELPSCNPYELKTELHDERIQEAVIVGSELPSCNPYELKTELHDEKIQEALIVDSELPSCNPYVLKTELHDERIQEAVIVDSILRDDDEKCNSVNLTIQEDPNATMPIKQICDVGLPTYGEGDCNTQTTELPDVEKHSLNTVLAIDTLECNLEVLGCNDEVIDTITVDAEIHYEN